MGTQFSKVKVTQRVELHGEVFNHAEGDYDTGELPDLFTRRAHHSGVLSGHELLSYREGFREGREGQGCQPTYWRTKIYALPLREGLINAKILSKIGTIKPIITYWLLSYRDGY